MCCISINSVFCLPVCMKHFSTHLFKPLLRPLPKCSYYRTCTEMPWWSSILTVEEVKALKHFKQSKEPDPIGIYYKSFLSHCTPRVVSLYNHILQGKHVNRDFLMALITAILKPGKDPNLTSNYWPISFFKSKIPRSLPLS